MPMREIGLPPEINMEYFLDQPGPCIKYIAHNPWELLLPMAVGAYLIMPFAWALAYAILYYAVNGITKTYQAKRRQMIGRRHAAKKEQAAE